MANKTTRKQTTRRSRNRRGSSRRLVRKNKTCKRGGGMFDNMKYATVGADVFIATGYKRAKNALLSYPVENWPPVYRMPGGQSTLNVFQISELYKTYYRDKGNYVKVPKYTYTKTPIGTYVYSQKGSETTPVLQPDDFKDVLTYVVENKGDSKSGPVQNVRNERYANFAESLDKFIQGTDELKSMTKIPVNPLASMKNILTNALSTGDGRQMIANAQNSAKSLLNTDLARNVTGAVMKNAPGPLGAVARIAPGFTGAVATKAASTVAGLAAKNPVGAMKMVKNLGLFGSK